MTDLEQLARIIQAESTWSAVMSDGYTSVGRNSPEHIAQAIINAGWTAPPAQTSGYTKHGHPIKGQVQSGKRPPISRCGGPRLCTKCAKETN